MTMIGWMSVMRIKEVEDRAKIFTDYSTKCKCGHTILITSKDGKALCTWCHNYVFANREARIKYRNKEALIKARRELDEQRRNDVKIDASLVSNIVTENKNMPKEAIDNLIISLITLNRFLQRL